MVGGSLDQIIGSKANSIKPFATILDGRTYILYLLYLGSLLDPRMQALSGWIFLLKRTLQQQGVSIDAIEIDLHNPGKVCKYCFLEFRKYNKLQVQLEGNLSVALQHMALQSHAQQV